MKQALAAVLSASLMQAADLPVTKVILYKNGVAYYERAGEVKAGEPGRLDFQASEMDDVLKSLVVDAKGGVSRIRYELSEPLQRKLAGQGIQIREEMPLVQLLDRWRGAHIELKYGGVALTGVIISGRLAPLPQQGQRQELSILTDSGEMRLIDLEAAQGLKLTDAKLQQQFVDALAAIAQSRSKDKRAVFIDTAAGGKLIARYLIPAAVWKSSYRLALADTGDSTLEGWAIVDNASGEDWTNVDLTVVSGRPVSFISRLYEPKFLTRPEVSLPDDQPVAPVLYESAMKKEADARAEGVAVGGMRADRAAKSNRAFAPAMAMAPAPAPESLSFSAGSGMLNINTEAREAGELFEYRFSTPVTAKKGESMLLPFLQQKIGARKLLVYSDRSQLNPRNAAEITNITGKTLDGGPITVYQAGGYSGEALMETLKAGEKRLISYSVDQGTRVTTNFETTSDLVRSFKANRGILITNSAIVTTTTYTIDNADAKEKTLVIEHPVDPTQKLLSPKADETSANKYRFNIKLAAKGNAKLAVVQERELQQTIMVSSLTPDVLADYIQNKQLTAAARKQLEAIAAKKADIASADNELRQIDTQTAEISRDQERIRQNINSLSRIAGQEAQVNRYAAELAKLDTTLAQLRDRQSELRKRHTTLDTELNALIEKLEF
ncbi:DUF4139 domain-containing protein [Paludibaculum fermentans]|uniref:DUF4139 domain-containing protein n=1 Tax=Paludibaculum fermentans TaxID=1473598 RepID=A0A7S7NPN9_PALFE|nr:DUF4139 domain-containing protein [Paludibaculum fermentans]QOY86999.1 DUF4139 domain-containing protein [Paludibaculum fermentans]